MTSYTQRQMRRHRFSAREKPVNMGQTFFLLDCQTGQPVCFTLASAAQSVLDASPALLSMGAEILGARAGAPSKPLVLTDKEHYSEELFNDYPQRWQVEEFFKFDEALGWHRTGTSTLHIRYGQMTMALLAQAAIYQLRQRLGPPVAQLDSPHLARNLFQGLEGNIRVEQDTIVVTFYNAPNVELLRAHYENLPAKLQRQSPPKVARSSRPWAE
jgi:hypothetical protein